MMTEIDANAVTDFLSQHEVDEPIVIKRQGTPHAVMIPCDIFHAMHRENHQALRVDELTDEDIEAILASKPPTGHGRNNGNFDD